MWELPCNKGTGRESKEEDPLSKLTSQTGWLRSSGFSKPPFVRWRGSRKTSDSKLWLLYASACTGTHTNTHLYIHTHTLTHTHIYTFTPIHTYTYTHLHAHTLIHTHVFTHTYTYRLMHTHIYILVHNHTLLYIYTFTHSHTQRCKTKKYSKKPSLIIQKQTSL